VSCAPLAVLALSFAAPVQPSGPAVMQVAASAPAALGISAPQPAAERPPALRVALDTAVVTTISVEVLKRTFKDERPVGSGYAFPSGHAATSFALARVASEYHPRYRWLWYAIAARIAWSRVKVRAHDWDDVIAGAALGCWLGDVETDRGGIVLKRWEW